MTVLEARRAGEAQLTREGIENARFEADTLLGGVIRRSRTQLLLQGDTVLEKQEEEAFLSFLKQRCSGRPLQYLLGEWDFLGLTLQIGEGVLIPRPETEQLALIAIETLAGRAKPPVFDLCAGSGCIGLSVASKVPESSVFLLEYSEDAFRFLEKNAARLALPNVRCMKADILQGFSAFSLPRPQLIVSNPPYIPSAQLPLLQKEVQKEPAMALDGGADGLRFYRILREQWYPHLLQGGNMLLECGENQAKEIAALFPDTAKKQILRDLQGIERIVAISAV